MNRSGKFAPCPENIFEHHIHEYFTRCRARCPEIEAICGKWRFEDLIPGMSDFDTRFLVSDSTGPSDWVRISHAVGYVHTAICREDPGRARILEHLPGINLTWSEASDPRFYYPEFQQWTIYEGDGNRISDFGDYLAFRTWNSADELYCVKKFALYFTPYDREIDPPINLHEYESKYPLHSRFMHYFCPPVQSAVCIMKRRMIRGKAESLRYARELFPNPAVIDGLFDALEAHYECPELYREPRLSALEDELFAYLKDVMAVIAPMIDCIDASPDDTSETLRAKLAHISGDDFGLFFEGVKFSRLMAGRLMFYAETVPRFDSSWLIEHELGRIRRNFFEAAFTAFGRLVWRESLSAEEVLDRCRDEFIDRFEYDDVKAYADIFARRDGTTDLKAFAVEVAACMGPFQIVLEKLAVTARQLAGEQRY